MGSLRARVFNAWSTTERACAASGLATLPAWLCRIASAWWVVWMKAGMALSGMARFSAKAVGAAPIRISMIRPMPFCPSLPPCENDTPVQVRISRPRIHSGGGFLPWGAW